MYTHITDRGTNGGITNNNGMEEGSEKKELGKIILDVGKGGCGMVVRVLALIFTLAAAILAGTNKQTKVVPINIADYVAVHAKWHYLSANVYVMAANVIACAYAAVSLVIALANKGKRSKYFCYFGLVIFILDAIMVALLFSGVGAGSSVGVLGYHGNSHVQWNKVCNVFVRFCRQMVASIALSLAGSLQFLFLLLLPFFRLRPKT